MSTRRVTVVTYCHAHLRQPHWTASLEHFRKGDPTGFAMTEAEAVMDLYAQINEREEAEELAECGSDR